MIRIIIKHIKSLKQSHAYKFTNNKSYNEIYT